MKHTISLGLLFLLIPAVSFASPSQQTDKYGITLIKIPGGTFMMGDETCKTIKYDCPTDDPFTARNEAANCVREETKCVTGRDARLVHKVILNPFWLSATEVTQKQFFQVMGFNPSEFKTEMLGYRSENNPVEKVYWHQAEDFCQRVGYRLPTEPGS